MPSKKTSFTVGLFMLAGLAIAVTAIIWLGMSHYFEKGRYYVAYFDESVQGLDKDSPVKYRGVTIGRVHTVSVAPDGTLIEVVLLIEDGLKVESDMVAQLKSVGITGIMFIEIDRKKDSEPDYLPPISFYTKYPIIRTKPSGMKLFMDGVDEVLAIVNQFDTKGISENLKKALENFDQTVRHADQTITEINTLITDNKKEINKAVGNANHFMMQGEELMKSAELQLSDLQRHLVFTLQNLEKASEGLNNFVDTISDRPSRLIFGQPVPSKKADR